jgi:hypothetical protein
MRRSSTDRTNVLRESLNKNKPLALALAGAGVIVAVALAVLRPSESGGQGAFYSIDDGTSFFEATPSDKPVYKQGQPAVQAVVFQDDSGSRFVGYLVRRDPNAPAPEAGARPGANEHLQVKAPGSGEWLSVADPKNAQAVAKIRAVKAPDGSHAIEVFPE